VQYLLLIYQPEGQWETTSESDQQSMMGEYNAFTEGLRIAGAMVDGNQLAPSDTATTVRVRNDERLLSDGPFAETREVLGGYYLVECETLDEAIGHAADIPGARTGSIEVRPIVQVTTTTA
jgi:hypothetical protein